MISVNDMRRAKEREKMRCDVTRREAISRQFHLSRRLLCSMFNHCEMWSGDFVLRPLPHRPRHRNVDDYDMMIESSSPLKTWARWTTAWLMANDKDLHVSWGLWIKVKEKNIIISSDRYPLNWCLLPFISLTTAHTYTATTHVQLVKEDADTFN